MRIKRIIINDTLKQRRIHKLPLEVRRAGQTSKKILKNIQNLPRNLRFEEGNCPPPPTTMLDPPLYKNIIGETFYPHHL